MGRRAKPRTTVTLEEVARIAGVSPSTVSRALNEPKIVRAKTVEAVHRAIELTGYTPNLLAGGLASSRSRMVALIVPTIANSIFSEEVQAITDTLAEAGYHTLLGLSGYDPEEEQRLIKTVIGRRADAVILTGTRHTQTTRGQLLAAGIPVVETWDMSTTPIDMLVGFSHEEIGRATARHLHGLGYRNFALVSADDQRANLRADGLRAELSGFGIHEVPTSSLPAPAQLPLGRRGLSELLDAGVQPDVVVCSSDTLAHGVLVEAQERAIRVPVELAVMGFGDLSFAAYTSPPLSTVRVDGALIGRLAAEAVVSRLAGETVSEPVRNVGFTVIGRGTTGF